MKINPSKPILVTGGSGYIASWVVKYLLEEGHTVHTTVRDKTQKDKYLHLEEIANNSKGKLVVFDADLMKKDSFLEAMQECELVIHMASPFFVVGIKDAQKDLIGPAKDGTANVLHSANVTKSVKRIVLTSSCASIYGDNCDLSLTKDKVFTEEYWNTTSSLSHSPYSYSKTVAEQEAWKIANAQSQWDLLTINPAFVLGPSLTKRTDSTSINMMIQLGNGTFSFGVPELWFGITDVRDVARAHILAGFTPTAKGRHISCTDSIELYGLAEYLREKFTDKYPFPKWKVPYFMVWLFGPILGFSHEYVEKNIGIPVKFDNSYTQKDLGLKFTDIKQTVCDHFEQLLQDGIIKRKD
ncbi:MAG: NAD-dependent epimerase/dehydratase family protein [Leptospiraceae bacterium]|nr:NAD-dependent epimerase/dehydratase family protein [Leptospiraceae bacterium]